MLEITLLPTVQRQNAQFHCCSFRIEVLSIPVSLFLIYLVMISVKCTRILRFYVLGIYLIVETCFLAKQISFLLNSRTLGKRTPFTYCLKAKPFLQQMFVVFTLGRCSYHSFPGFTHISFFFFTL